jgi:hypothetical protein
MYVERKFQTINTIATNPPPKPGYEKQKLTELNLKKDIAELLSHVHQM